MNDEQIRRLSLVHRLRQEFTPDGKAINVPQIQREAADEIERLRAIVDPIERLRAPEGAFVEIACSNPDYNGLPNECVTVCDDWTGNRPIEFRADTVAECLAAAESARDAKRKVP